MHVVIATDGTDDSVAAAARALAYLPEHADIELVTVIAERVDPDADAGGFEGPVMTDEEADADFAENEAAGRAAINATERRFGERTVTERILTTDGSAAAALLDLANDADEGVDLLVVGPSRSGWLDRLFRRGTDDELIHHAPCPVLVMNQPR